MSYARVIVKKERRKDARQLQSPWVYSNQIHKAPYAVQAGEVVCFELDSGELIGTGYYNPQSQIAGRVLSQNKQETIDQAFFKERFERSRQYRDKLFPVPYYRFCHAEGDRMPGLVIDRFGDVLICQTSTLGMERLKPIWLPALIEVLQPKTVLFRDDVPSRAKEGLELKIEVAYGELPKQLQIIENDISYFSDALHGQKTGWFYDQRANRAWVKAQAQGKTAVDLYSYCGGFGANALKGGAQKVTFVDRSELAATQIESNVQNLELAQNQSYEVIKTEVYSFLEECIEAGKTFDLVIADPPAFIKHPDHKASGLKGYEKLAKMCAEIVAPNGLLLMGSCSHHASMSEFKRAVGSGLTKAKLNYHLIYEAGADKDHPVHPHLKQTQYLKALGFQVI